jgi:hypothetical protein
MSLRPEISVENSPAYINVPDISDFHGVFRRAKYGKAIRIDDSSSLNLKVISEMGILSPRAD